MSKSIEDSYWKILTRIHNITIETNQEQGNEESYEPSDPNISPVVLVAVDSRERIDQGKTKESEDQQRSKQWSSSQVDHVVDIALKRMILLKVLLPLFINKLSYIQN